MRAERSSSAPAEDGAPVSDAIRARERGLSLLRRANRWLIGLAVLLAGAFTGLTAHAFHSTSSASARTATGPSGEGSGQGTGQGSGGATAPQLQPPASPPGSGSSSGSSGSSGSSSGSSAPAPAGPVVSGGS